MSRTTRKVLAAIILILLVGLPFIDWKLGALLWICAWLVFIFQNLLGQHRLSETNNDEEDDLA